MVSYMDLEAALASPFHIMMRWDGAPTKWESMESNHEKIDDIFECRVDVL